MPGLPSGILGVQAVGRETCEEYTSFVGPLVEEQQRSGQRVRFLYHLGSEFPSATALAVVNDLRLGRRLVHAFEKCAVVSDAASLRTPPELTGTFMPCPILAVANGDLELAVDWLSAPHSTANLELELTREWVLVMRPQGAVSREELQTKARLLTSWMLGRGALRGMVLNLEQLSKPADTAALLDHLRLMQQGHEHIRRVAPVVDADRDVTSRLAQIFDHAEVRPFSPAHERAAITWCERDPC